MKSDWWSCDGRGGKEAPPANEAPRPSGGEGAWGEGLRISRRGLLSTLGLGAVWWASAKSALSQVAISGNRDGNALVVLFLRGGADGLNIVVPYAEDTYYRARPTINLARPNDRTRTDRVRDLDGFFGLHPALDPLLPLYESKRMAIVQATGSNDETRSHFEAMNAMERGLPDQRSGDQTGWLARHLSNTPGPTSSPLRAVAFASTMPDSLRGAPEAIALQSLEEFRLRGDSERAKWLEQALRTAYAGGKDEMAHAGRETLEVLDRLNRLDLKRYGTGAYPASDLAQGLRQVALLLKAEVGLEIACLDMGGWDTHVAQGGSSGWQASLLSDLASSLVAFFNDLGSYSSRVTLVVQTEFGRRLQENTGLGTDHGHGGLMFLLGGGVRGGRVYGEWPGLGKDQLTGPGDLQVTTDYRNVLAEVLADRLANKEAANAFPGLQPRFLGVTG